MTVRIDKDTVTTALRERGDHDRAVQAECVLPRSVDTERDAGLLIRHDVNADALEATPED
jgi:hypothetical protein